MSIECPWCVFDRIIEPAWTKDDFQGTRSKSNRRIEGLKMLNIFLPVVSACTQLGKERLADAGALEAAAAF